MAMLTFPTSKLAPVEDTTERHWTQIAAIAKDFEEAAFKSTDPDRLCQLHQRVHACLQTLNDTDDLIRSHWEAVVRSL